MQDRPIGSELCSPHKIPWDKCPKYSCCVLTQAELDEITLNAAKRALELGKVEAMTATGCFVITKIGYFIGFALLSIVIYLVKIGVLNYK